MNKIKQLLLCVLVVMSNSSCLPVRDWPHQDVIGHGQDEPIVRNHDRPQRSLLWYFDRGCMVLAGLAMLVCVFTSITSDTPYLPRSNRLCLHQLHN